MYVPCCLTYSIKPNDFFLFSSLYKWILVKCASKSSFSRKWVIIVSVVVMVAVVVVRGRGYLHFQNITLLEEAPRKRKTADNCFMCIYAYLTASSIRLVQKKNLFHLFYSLILLRLLILLLNNNPSKSKR